MRNKQKHLYLVRRRYFRIYYSGAYALWEFDFGRIGRGEFVLLLGCVSGGHNGVPRKFRLVNWTYNKRTVPKEEPLTNDIAY